jgi:two-component system cell cycle response regulator
MASRPPAGDARSFDDEEESTLVGLRVPVIAQTGARAVRSDPHLIVLAGESVGRTYRLEHAETVIGRSDDAAIRVRDEGVSRRHAKLVREGTETWLEDMKSANGTRLNAEPIVRSILRDGDKIHIGEKTILKFSNSDALEESFHKAMYEAAVRDGMTRAYNKRHFLERLASESAYARRHQSALSLLMLDVDHFKKVNDNHGHPAGDYVLTTLGQVLMATVRVEDLVARYGGEEFAVLCRGTPLANALLLAERLRRSVEAHPFAYREQRIPVTISVGLSECSASAQSAQELIGEADTALYDAKRSGRNRVVAHTPPRGK